MNIDIFIPDQTSELSLKNAGRQISAGFPSPAEDYLEPDLDLNRALIKNQSSTFFGRIKGSMNDFGVYDGDLLVIDKSLPYRTNALAVCYINGEFTLKRIKLEGKILMSMPTNKESQPIVIKEDDNFQIFGIVTYIIHKA